MASGREENPKLCEEAIHQFKTALRYDPARIYIYQFIGLVYEGMGNLEVALRHHRLAVVQDPECPDYHESLGSVLKDLGRTDEALREFQMAENLGGPGFVTDEWFEQRSKNVI